ncbi:hypothetical protein BKA62DRAFT_672145 [Auriculariales sp. MPI-PUGE-AT-0066]|nr:hypothetical protein BKA62DRAFT_672145 [Auriculariales sp. MPI-PUGE-AT-0066]
MGFFPKLFGSLRRKRSTKYTESSSLTVKTSTGGSAAFGQGAIRRTLSVPLTEHEIADNRRMSEADLLRISSRNCSTYSILDPLDTPITHPINNIATSNANAQLSRASSYSVRVTSQQTPSRTPSAKFPSDAPELPTQNGWERIPKRTPGPSNTSISTRRSTATLLNMPPPLPLLPPSVPPKVPSAVRRKPIPSLSAEAGNTTLLVQSDPSVRALAGLYSREGGLDSAFHNSPVKLPVSRSTDAVNLLSEPNRSRPHNRRHSMDLHSLLHVSPSKATNDPGNDSGDSDVLTWADRLIERTLGDDGDTSLGISSDDEQELNMLSFSSMTAEVGSADVHESGTRRLSETSTTASLVRGGSLRANQVFDFLLTKNNSEGQIKRSASAGSTALMSSLNHRSLVESNLRKTAISTPALRTPNRTIPANSSLNKSDHDVLRQSNDKAGTTLSSATAREDRNSTLPTSSFGSSLIPLPVTRIRTQEVHHLSQAKMHGPRPMPSPMHRTAPLLDEDVFSKPTIPAAQMADPQGPFVTPIKKAQPAPSPRRRTSIVDADKENASVTPDGPISTSGKKCARYDSIADGMSSIPVTPLRPSFQTKANGLTNSRYTFGTPVLHNTAISPEGKMSPGLQIPPSPVVSTTSSSELSPYAQDLMSEIRRQKTQRLRQPSWR